MTLGGGGGAPCIERSKFEHVEATFKPEILIHSCNVGILVLTVITKAMVFRPFGGGGRVIWCVGQKTRSKIFDKTRSGLLIATLYRF